MLLSGGFWQLASDMFKPFYCLSLSAVQIELGGEVKRVYQALFFSLGKNMLIKRPQQEAGRV